MSKYTIWNKTDILVTPSGRVLTPEDAFKEYPAAQLEGFKYVVLNQPVNMAIFFELESMKTHYKQQGVEITDGMTDQQVLEAIEAWENRPVEVVASPEERMAAALEFQAAMSLPQLPEEE